jgi:hypothetical protein
VSKDELIKRLAQTLHKRGQGLKALEQPWSALGEGSREYYLISARLLLPLIVGFVAEWIEGAQPEHDNWVARHLAARWCREMGVCARCHHAHDPSLTCMQAARREEMGG